MLAIAIAGCQPKPQQLFDAVSVSDYTTAGKLVERGVALDAPHSFETSGEIVYQGAPVLALAVESGDVRMVRGLLDAGADPDATFTRIEPGGRTATGCTPLAVAAGADQQEIAALLLEAGADPNATFAVEEAGGRWPPGVGTAARGGGRGPQPELRSLPPRRFGVRQRHPPAVCRRPPAATGHGLAAQPGG
jgi:hypothetical protein